MRSLPATTHWKRLSDLDRVPRLYRGLVKAYCREVMRTLGTRLASVCLFGSVARNEYKKESDIDFLLLATSLPRSVLARSSVTAPAHKRLQKNPAILALSNKGHNTFISEIILTPKEASEHPSILLDITADGIILYDRKNTLGSELEKIRRRLLELGSRRISTRHGRYWLLKPDIIPGETVEI